MIEFWFWKPIGEVLGVLALIVAVIVAWLAFVFLAAAAGVMRAWLDRNVEPRKGDTWSTSTGDVRVADTLDDGTVVLRKYATMGEIGWAVSRVTWDATRISCRRWLRRRK